MIALEKSLLVKERITQLDLYICEKQALDTDPKAMQQINFTSILDQAGNTTMYLL